MRPYFQEITDPVTEATTQAVSNIVAVLPSLFSALLILMIGSIVAGIAKGVTIRVFKAAKIDKFLKKVQLGKVLEGAKFDPLKFSGELIRWFVLIVFLLPAVEVLGLKSVSPVLNQVLLYLPNVFVAVIILMVGVVIAEFSQDFVEALAASLGSNVAKTLGQVAKVSILVFTVLITLSQLGIAADLVRIFFAGLVFMLALAGGLALGLGGQNIVTDLWEKTKKGKE